MAQRLSRELLLKLTADTAGATRVEREMERVNRVSNRVIEAQTRMATSSHKLSHEFNGLNGGMGKFITHLDRVSPRLSRIAVGFNGIVGKVGQLNTAIAALGATWAARQGAAIYRSGMATNANLETSMQRMAAEIRQEREGINSALKRSQAETKWALSYQRESRVYQLDEIQHTLSDMAVLYRGDMQKAREATRLAGILAAKNPHQGLEGAKIAIQEAESGVWTSAQRRFFLPKNILEQNKEKGGLGALQATLKSMRVDDGLVRAMGNTAPGMQSQIKSLYDQVWAGATKGAYESRRQHLAFVRERLEGLTTEKGALTKIAASVSEIGGKMSKLYYGALEFPIRNAEKILKFLNNLKKGLDPTIALLKSFGKAFMSGFMGPLQAITFQAKQMAGMGGFLGQSLSKAVGLVGKGVTSPLLLLKPLAAAMGGTAGFGMSQKLLHKLGIPMFLTPGSAYGAAKRGVQHGLPLLKSLWHQSGIPLNPSQGMLHFSGATAGTAMGGLSGMSEAEYLSEMNTAKQKRNRRKREAEVLEDEFAESGSAISGFLHQFNTIRGMRSNGGVMTMLASGNLSGIIERQFMNHLSLFNDLAQASGNIANGFSGIMEGVQGLLNPVNALGVAVGAVVAPFTILAKMLNVITTPINSGVGRMAMHGIGKVAGPLMIPAMFAMGAGGGINMIRQLMGMVHEGPQAFGQGWSKRVMGAFLGGTDFQPGSRGAIGASRLSGPFAWLSRQSTRLASSVSGSSRFGRAGQPLAMLLNGVGGFFGRAANGGTRRFDERSGQEYFSQFGGLDEGMSVLTGMFDIAQSRIPGLHKRATRTGRKLIDGRISTYARETEELKRKLQSSPMGHHARTELSRKVAFRERQLSMAQQLIQGADSATLNSAKGLRGLNERVSAHLNSQTYEESLQDTLERLLTQTPAWFSQLPAWYTQAPSWLSGISGSGGSSGASEAPAEAAVDAAVETATEEVRKRFRRIIRRPATPSSGGGTGADEATASATNATGILETIFGARNVSRARALPRMASSHAKRMFINAAQGANLLQNGRLNLSGANFKKFATDVGTGVKELGSSLGRHARTIGNEASQQALGIVSGFAGAIPNHIRGGAARLGGLGIPGMAGLGSSAASFAPRLATIMPSLWPLMLGGGAIAAFVSLAKHIGRRLGGLNLGSGLQSVRNRFAAAGQKIEGAAGFAASIMPKIGLVGGGLIGAGIGGKLMALGTKSLPLPARIIGMGLGGLLGARIGQGAGTAAGSATQHFFDLNPRNTKASDWLTGGNILPMLLGGGMMFGSRFLPRGALRSVIGHAGGIMSGAWIPKLLGGALKGASWLTGGQRTAVGRGLAGLGTGLTSTAWMGQGLRTLGIMAGRNNIVGKSLIGLSGITARGIGGSLLGAASQIPALRGLTTQAAWMAQAPGGIAGQATQAAAARSPFIANLMAQYARNNAPLTLSQKLTGAARGLWNSGKFLATKALPSLLGYAIGAKGLHGSWSNLTAGGKALRLTSRLGMAGILASAFGAGGSSASAGAVPDSFSDAKQGSAATGGSQGSLTGLGMMLGGAGAAFWLKNKGVLAKLDSAARRGNKLAKGARGLGSLFGVSSKGAAQLASKVALRGGAGALGIASLPVLGQGIMAAMGGWEAGKWLGNQKFGGKHTINANIQEWMYQTLFGGKRLDAQNKQTQIALAQVKAGKKGMIDGIKSQSATGVKDIEAASTRGTENLWERMRNALSGFFERLKSGAADLWSKAQAAIAGVFGGGGASGGVTDATAGAAGAISVAGANGLLPQAGKSLEDNFVHAIASQESGHKYDARNKRTGAMGKYQVMPQNLDGSWGGKPGRKNFGWDFDALGYDVTPEQFMASPEIQEKIAQHQMRRAFQQHGAAGAARVWYSGTSKSSSRRPAAGEPSPDEYAASVLNHMSKLPAPGSIPVSAPSAAAGAVLPSVSVSITPQQGLSAEQIAEMTSSQVKSEVLKSLRTSEAQRALLGV